MRDFDRVSPESKKGTAVSTSVAEGVPDAAKRLIWQTFFENAGRGVNFATHLPWHADTASRTVMLAGGDGSTLAAAVVRPARQAGVAMVGFVCVAAAERGQGHGRTLVSAINAAVDAAGYRAALMWTGQPEVYTGNGYDSIARDDFLRVIRLSPVSAQAGGIISSVWPGAHDPAALPAFATTACRLRTDSGEAIIADGPRGATLIGWSGTAADVVAIVDAAGYAAWNVNVRAGDEFSAALPADRFAVTVLPGAVTMMRCADPLFVPDPVAVVDRI